MKEKKSFFVRISIWIIAIGFVFFVFTVVFTFSVIYKDVKAISVKAKEEYKQDCVHSLIALFNSSSHSDKEENLAIYALGQIADKEALPFLQDLEKKYSCPGKTKYQDSRCYEIKKAIKWCTKGNITNWMYKGRDEWQ